MEDLACDEIGDGREPDMRMRADVEAAPGSQHRRTERVEEHERPNARSRPTAARDGR